MIGSAERASSPLFAGGCALGAIVAAGAGALPPWRARVPLLAAGLALATLALPLDVDRSLIVNHEFDSGRTGAMASSEVGALIVKDLRPILSLTSSGSHELVPVARLVELATSGQLRYVVIDGACRAHTARSSPACSVGAAWTRAHGVDVSRAIGLGRSDVLYRLR